MFMPCGPKAVPTGGAGVALPASNCSFKTVLIGFLAMVAYFNLNLANLQRIQFDRGLAAEDRYHHFNPAARFIHFRNLAIIFFKWPVNNFYQVTYRQIYIEFAFIAAHAV